MRKSGTAFSESKGKIKAMDVYGKLYLIIFAALVSVFFLGVWDNSRGTRFESYIVSKKDFNKSPSNNGLKAKVQNRLHNRNPEQHPVFLGNVCELPKQAKPLKIGEQEWLEVVSLLSAFEVIKVENGKDIWTISPGTQNDSILDAIKMVLQPYSRASTNCQMPFLNNYFPSLFVFLLFYAIIRVMEFRTNRVS